MKHIHVDFKQHVKDVVDLEDRILWASSSTVVVPKDMKYPKTFKSGTPGAWNFIKGCLP